MSPHGSLRRGLSLAEVLVCVSILIVLILMLLPALQTVRINDPRLHCQNNLKQIALAWHNYQGTRKGRLPTGTIVDSAKEPGERLSFLVTLLPYLEQETVYKSLDLKQGWDAPANQPGVTKSMWQFTCPLRTAGSRGMDNLTSYVGVTGVGSDSARLGVDHPRAGVFSYDQPRNVADLPDGATNAILLLETMSRNGPWAAGGLPTLRGISESDPSPIRDGGAFDTRHSVTSWGRRVKTTSAAMGDGRVVTLSAEVDGKLLAAMAAINGR